MAATFTPESTKQPKVSMGNMWAVVGTLTFDSTYPAGGEAITPQIFGLKKIVFLTVGNSSAGHSAQWDKTNSKVLLRVAHGTPGATVPLLEQTTADQSATTCPVFAIGF